MARPRYNRTHQRARQTGLKALPVVSPCVRCGHDMDKRADEIDLDHDERGGYLGFSHRSPCRVCGLRCNQYFGGLKSAELAGKRPRERRCVICGTPFEAARGRTSATQETCGKGACVAALKASRRARHADPEPPQATGRLW